MSEKPKPTTGDLSERITEYLCAGGLFNPELMEHEKVRDLLMDCRDALQPKPTGEWTDAAREAARQISAHWRSGKFRQDGGVVEGITPIVQDAINAALDAAIDAATYDLKLLKIEEYQECRKQLEASQKYAELLEQGRRDAIAAAQQPLVDELQNIVSDLDGMRKDFGDDTDRQFRLWAQSRARSALAKVGKQ